MSGKRKSMLLYFDNFHRVAGLPDEQLGILFRALMECGELESSGQDGITGFEERYPGHERQDPDGLPLHGGHHPQGRGGLRGKVRQLPLRRPAPRGTAGEPGHSPGQFFAGQFSARQFPAG